MATKSSATRLPSKPMSVIKRSSKPGVFLSNPGDVVVEGQTGLINSDCPTPVISLARGRFAARVLIPLGVFVTVLSFFAYGQTIQKNVLDVLGSTEKADAWVSFYQVVNGLVTTVISTVFDGYVMVFIVVARTYLRNLRWISDPQAEPSSIKRLVLWLLCPAIMYNVHIGVTSMFVSHTVTGFERNFVSDDLQAPGGALQSTFYNSTTAANRSMTANGVSVLDTILRGAVLQTATPFKMEVNSPCMVKNATGAGQWTKLPSVKEVGSTSVVYGFPTRDWNVDALPFGLHPSHSFTVMFDNGTVPSNKTARFEAFLLEANVSWATLYETFLQGEVMFERAVSDTDATGYSSSLGNLENITSPAMYNLGVFVSTTVAAFNTTTKEIEPRFTNLTVEVFEMNPQIKLTAMTLDMPYKINKPYHDNSELCNGSELLPETLKTYKEKGILVDDETLRHLICDEDQYAYENPRGGCGRTSCVLVDNSESMSFKKQVQLMPYVKCSTKKLEYDEDFQNFFPTDCNTVNNTAFLYGVGSYIAGDEFNSGSKTGFPFISNPRRHVVLTFAKLEWIFQNISEAFGAECGVQTKEPSTRCSGLLYNLTNITVPAVHQNSSEDIYRRMLVLGEGVLPVDFKQADFRAPVQLLSLNSRTLSYPGTSKEFKWVYLNFDHFKATDWPTVIAKSGGLPGNSCSPLVDAYISMIKTNHYFIDDPRQPLYTSAIFYLFQNAAIKTVKYGANSTASSPKFGTTSLVGDLVRHTIMLKIPVMSLIMTFAGLGLLRALAVMATVSSTQRLRMAEDFHENTAHKYARFRQRDEYPRDIFDRGLKLRTSKHPLPIDECAVDSLTLHSASDTAKKLILKEA